MNAYPREVGTVAVVGLGTIGMSWAAYFLGRGLSVRATDELARIKATLGEAIA